MSFLHRVPHALPGSDLPNPKEEMMFFTPDRRWKGLGLPVLLAISLGAQSTPSNIGPTPPPQVNADLSVTYFLNAPNAKEVLLADTAISPGPPGRPLTKGPDGMWTVTTPPYEPGTHYYGFLIDGVLTGDLGGTAITDRLPRGFLLFESIDIRGATPLFTDVRAVPH